MTLTIPSFLFLVLAVLIFFNIREALKSRFLILASLVYVFCLSRYAGIVILFVSLLAWAAGIFSGSLAGSGHTRYSKALSGVFIAIAVAALHKQVSFSTI